MENRVLGQKIGALRKSKKITSEQLANMCNVYSGHMRQIESGVRLPSLKLFVTICNTLQVSPEYLLLQELDKFDESENVDCIYQKVMKNIKKLTPNELNMLNSLIETYLNNIESAKKS